jgi:hypothetical protein
MTSVFLTSALLKAVFDAELHDPRIARHVVIRPNVPDAKLLLGCPEGIEQVEHLQPQLNRARRR